MGQKTIVTGMPSSGSTVIWQILKDLGRNPKKVHGSQSLGKNGHTFVPIRDLRSALLSTAKRQENKIKYKNDNLLKAIIRSHNIFEKDKIYTASINFIKNSKQNPNIHIVRYEDFLPNNTEALVRHIVSILDIKISEDKIREIAKTRSIEQNKNLSNSLGFGNFHGPRKEEIHRNHISTDGSHDAWKKEFSKEIIEFLKPKINGHLQALGYVQDW